MNARNSNRVLAQAAIILFVFWVVALILLTRPLLNQPHGGEDSWAARETAQRLSRAIQELDGLKERNRELQWILANFSSGATKQVCDLF